MKVGRVPSLEDFLPEFWRHLTELLLAGGLMSVVTHFLRAALSSDIVRSPIISYLKLERNAMMYFKCRSISVHNNVKILAKCLIMSLEEVLALSHIHKLNWACQGDLQKLTEHMSSDMWWPQTTSHSNTTLLPEKPFGKVAGAILICKQFKFVLLSISLLQLSCSGSVSYHDLEYGLNNLSVSAAVPKLCPWLSGFTSKQNDLYIPDITAPFNIN